MSATGATKNSSQQQLQQLTSAKQPAASRKGDQVDSSQTHTAQTVSKTGAAVGSPSQTTTTTSVEKEDRGGRYEDEDDDTYVTTDQDEFNDAVEDVTQFSVTLPRTAKAGSLHQRNPSNISKLYLQESDDEDEYGNSDEEDEDKTTIKVTMHSAAISQEADAKSQAATASQVSNQQTSGIYLSRNPIFTEI